jgi:hypothetical protein
MLLAADEIGPIIQHTRRATPKRWTLIRGL